MLWKTYRYFGILSLDIVFGACVCTWFFSQYLSIPINIYAVLCLAISVWLIYTIDHLRDAKKVLHEAGSSRHRFHQQYFYRLLWVAMIVSIVGLFLLLFIPWQVVEYGLVLISMSAIYFVALWCFGGKAYLFKEIMASLVYGSGVFVIPLSLYSGSIDGLTITIFFQFVMMAFINLLLFSVFDYGLDSKDGHGSLIQRVGVALGVKLIWTLGLISLCTTLVIIGLFHDQPKVVRVEVVFSLMIICLLVILSRRKLFCVNDRYRALGDAIFFLPLIFLY